MKKRKLIRFIRSKSVFDKLSEYLDWMWLVKSIFVCFLVTPSSYRSLRSELLFHQFYWSRAKTFGYYDFLSQERVLIFLVTTIYKDFGSIRQFYNALCERSWTTHCYSSYALNKVGSFLFFYYEIFFLANSSFRMNHKSLHCCGSQTKYMTNKNAIIILNDSKALYYNLKCVIHSVE